MDLERSRQLMTKDKPERPVLLREKSAAEVLGLAPQTLRSWRCTKRYNLPFHKVGRRIFYNERDLLQFLESRRVAG